MILKYYIFDLKTGEVKKDPIHGKCKKAFEYLDELFVYHKKNKRIYVISHFNTGAKIYESDKGLKYTKNYALTVLKDRCPDKESLYSSIENFIKEYNVPIKWKRPLNFDPLSIYVPSIKF